MELPELLLIDKPAGITSFDVIRRLRRGYAAAHGGAKAPKLGHAGTLDPAATGLMLIGVGPGTKKLQDYIKLDKEYVADVLLGRSTTTGDIDGEVVAEKSVDAALSAADVAATVATLVGALRLPVSAYSAIKIAGVPLYKKAYAAAKRGEVVSEAELPEREMTVYEAELLDFHHQGDGCAVATIRFYVASGTYIRSLGEALGAALGYPAMLQSLRRTMVGEFDITNAVQIEEVTI